MLKRVNQTVVKSKFLPVTLRLIKVKTLNILLLKQVFQNVFPLPRLCLTEIRLKNTLLFPLNGSFMIHSSLAVSLSKCSFDSCGRVSVMVHAVVSEVSAALLSEKNSVQKKRKRISSSH